jgi:hypothetical protein
MRASPEPGAAHRPARAAASRTIMVRHRHSLAGTLALAMALWHPSAIAASPERPVDRLDEEAKAQWLRRDEPAGARASVALYDRMSAIDAGRAEHHVALARALWWYAMMRPQAAREERRAILGRCIEAARRGQRLAPLDPGGFYWEAAARVQAAAEGGGAVAPREIGRIRTLVAKVRALNPWYHHGSIRTVEAELILAMPAWQRWIMGESPRRAVDLMVEALGFQNNCFHGHWVLARALEASGRRGAAITQLDVILKGRLEAVLPDAPENRVVRRWALVWRARLSAPP